jgi:hypothetical protein
VKSVDRRKSFSNECKKIRVQKIIYWEAAVLKKEIPLRHVLRNQKESEKKMSNSRKFFYSMCVSEGFDDNLRFASLAWDFKCKRLKNEKFAWTLVYETTSFSLDD